MECAGRAGLALHLDHLRGRAPEVRRAGGGPRVGELPHRGRRRDRVDRDDLGEPMGDAGDRLVAIDRDPRAARHRSSRRNDTPAGQDVGGRR
jgi:hypothetical protein